MKKLFRFMKDVDFIKYEKQSFGLGINESMFQTFKWQRLFKKNRVLRFATKIYNEREIFYILSFFIWKKKNLIMKQSSINEEIGSSRQMIN